MLEPLLEAALQWLEKGMPLARIKIVVYSHSQAKDALPVFTEKKAAYLQTAPTSNTRRIDYDVFISYSRANAHECDILARALRECRPDIRIFVDRTEINVGDAWQSVIFENLDRCYKVVALLSPDYLNSKVCKDEFNIAWQRGSDLNTEILFPVFLFTAELPTYMKSKNYLDCREGNRLKLGEASRKLLAAIETAKAH